MSRLQKLILSSLVIPTITIVTLNTHGARAMTPDREGPATDAPTVIGGTVACCFDPSGCVNLTPTDCANVGGISRGPGTACATENCSSQGACCQGAGICEGGLSQFICEDGGGTYQGNGSPCQATETSCSGGADNDCDGATDCADSDCAATPACTGACCNPDGSCDDGVSSGDCTAGGGTYQGNTTTCAGVTCPPATGACCHTNNSCLLLNEADCSVVPSSGWAGPLTTCAGPFPASEVPGSTCCDNLDNDCDGLTDIGDLGDPDCAGSFCTNPALAITSGQLSCRKNRYICFQTNNPGAEIAIEIQRTSGSPMTGYAGPPDSQGNSGVYPAAHFRNNWPSMLCVGDCEISPVQSFSVRMIPGPSPGGVPSPALTVQTIGMPGIKSYGDTTGSFNATMPNQWDCPNGVTSANDFQMALQKFLGVSTAPHNTMSNIQGVDVLNPCLNTPTGISDVFLIVKAFQGERYPFYLCSGNGKTCGVLGAPCPTNNPNTAPPTPGDPAGTGVCELPNTTNCPPNTGSPNCPP